MVTPLGAFKIEGDPASVAELVQEQTEDLVSQVRSKVFTKSFAADEAASATEYTMSGGQLPANARVVGAKAYFQGMNPAEGASVSFDIGIGSNIKALMENTNTFGWDLLHGSEALDHLYTSAEDVKCKIVSDLTHLGSYPLVLTVVVLYNQE